MNESYQQFEDWWSKDKSPFTEDDELKEFSRVIWQASRAAIEIKLDDKVMVEDEFDAGHNCAIDYCAESIRAAGIKVKE
ncbi:hypothetical protein CCQ97_18410 [Salmonella enterica]|uniref:hypothetical protein n=1 Tax=Salmonella enterica TaxID=28901 RepID=UPI000FB513C4|nr:hypothetical protein [Salmonella enterica]EBQ0713889.1 hypothetical protein [Salmonella enterica subsp. enterica]EBV8265480.1 hypothetical protein [Salmonella enterica subsp. enterica serovar Rubislaw]EEM1821263.1 hypothetical protein [Salmonella enterica subsp. enterica serovar Abaetetuba]EAA9786301.1 hypothetical protein [Salmonella enterica]